MWGWYHYPPTAVAVSEQPRAGLFQQKKRLSQSGCSAPTDTPFPPAHSAFSALLCGGWYHDPRRALHVVETLDAQELRQRIRRFYAAPVLALCGLNLPSSGTHATPAPNRAHSGSHAETRGESAERRMQGCKVFKSLHPYILAPVNTSTIARRIFLK